jgi:hypothetical protein
MDSTQGRIIGQRARHVSTIQSINTFTAALNKFPTDFPGWPQFVRKYAISSPAMETLRQIQVRSATAQILYIAKPPQSFKFFAAPVDVSWTQETAAPIDRSGNTGAGFQDSSKTSCCLKLDQGGSGVYAFRTISLDPTSIHQLNIYNLWGRPAEKSTTPDINKPCNMGQELHQRPSI